MLLVDDDESCLDATQTLLQRLGHRCVTANSAAEALRICEQAEPALVVTDLAMPGMDGVCLARRLRARFPNLPLILVTGQDVQDPAITRELALFTRVIAKPFDRTELADVLPVARVALPA
jgi:CheY-like chemotaxis protein